MNYLKRFLDVLGVTSHEIPVTESTYSSTTAKIRSKYIPSVEREKINNRFVRYMETYRELLSTIPGMPPLPDNVVILCEDIVYFSFYREITCLTYFEPFFVASLHVSSRVMRYPVTASDLHANNYKLHFNYFSKIKRYILPFFKLDAPVVMDHVSYLERCARAVGLKNEDVINDLKSFYSCLMAGGFNVGGSSTSTIVATVLYLYIKIHGLSMSRRSIAIMLGINDYTITRLLKKNGRLGTV